MASENQADDGGRTKAVAEMPVDPFFTSTPTPRRTYSAEDRAEADRLLAKGRFSGDYKRLKSKLRRHEALTNGEFLFVRDIDQKRNWTNRARWRKNAKHYLGGNVKHNGAYSGSGTGSHAKRTR